MNCLRSHLSVRFQSALTKPRRFYKEVTVTEEANGNGYGIQLDQRNLRTRAGNSLTITSQPLALAIAQEWRGQKETLALGAMRLTGLAFTAIDNPMHMQREDIVNKVLEYLETDTILYRATEPEKLVQLKKQNWDPVVEWANDRYGMTIRPSTSVITVPEIDSTSRKRIRGHLNSFNFWSLTGIQHGVEAVKSLLITLAALCHRLDVESAVDLATLEQNFQKETWGNVEWAHDVERAELQARFAAALLFVHWTSHTERREEEEQRRR